MHACSEVIIVYMHSIIYSYNNYGILSQVFNFNYYAFHSAKSRMALSFFAPNYSVNYFSDAVIGLSVMGSAEHSEGDDLTYCVNTMAQGAILRMVMYNIDFNGITAGEITKYLHGVHVHSKQE